MYTNVYINFQHCYRGYPSRVSTQEFQPNRVDRAWALRRLGSVRGAATLLRPNDIQKQYLIISTVLKASNACVILYT